MQFRTESRDGPCGQSNLRLVIEVDGNPIGRVDYSVFRGAPSIVMIEVHAGSLRQGYGTALVVQLQREYPDQEISWGMLTDGGAMLYQSIPKQFLQNAEFAVKQKELAEVKANLEVYSKLGDQFNEIDVPSKDQRDAFLLATGDWNSLHDAEWDLEQYLSSNQPGMTMIVLPEDINVQAERPRG